MINEKEILRAEGLKRTYLVNETKIEVLKGINLTVSYTHLTLPTILRV